MKAAIIFGGSGFIGVFYAKYLIKYLDFSKIYIYDLRDYKTNPFRENLLAEMPVEFIQGDVRKPINLKPKENIDLIVNLAAIHREPGHKINEYYETNITGAENICKHANYLNCNKIIFTSSIAPYGNIEKAKDENTIPTPTSAYGGSKLVAEKIHLSWQSEDQDNKRLVIVRPGVVYGPSEGGNVSRMINAVINRYFVYIGNKNTKKAGIYIKELCNMLSWAMYNEDVNDENVILFNAVLDEHPSISNYVNSICKVKGIRRNVFSLPFAVLLTACKILNFILNILNISHPFDPVRIKKLASSNEILPTYLTKKNYTYSYNLESSLRDWYKDNPGEWR